MSEPQFTPLDLTDEAARIYESNLRSGKKTLPASAALRIIDRLRETQKENERLAAAGRCEQCDGRGRWLEHFEPYDSDRVVTCDECDAGRTIATLEKSWGAAMEERTKAVTDWLTMTAKRDQLRERLTWVEKAHSDLVDENERLLVALKRIAYEPQGPAEASHADVLRAVERIAREAIAKTRVAE